MKIESTIWSVGGRTQGIFGNKEETPRHGQKGTSGGESGKKEQFDPNA